MVFKWGNPFGGGNQPTTGPNNQQMQPTGDQNTNLNNPGGPQANNSMTLPGGGNSGGSGTPGNSQQQQQQPQDNNAPKGDPMLQFDKLWHNESSTDPNQQNQPATKKSYVPQFKPEQLQQIVGQWDFTSKVLTPELTAAIAGGGEGAVKAIGQVINQSVQQALLTSFQANSRLVDASLNAAETGFFEKVPNHVKDVMTLNSLTSSNPLMSDPKYGPLIDATRQQFQTKFPKATPEQIQNSVNSYFDEMYKDMTGIRDKKSNVPVDNNVKLKEGAPDGDWNEWIAEDANKIFGDMPINQQQNQQTNPNQQQQQQGGGSYTF